MSPWALTPLADVATIVAGQSPPGNEILEAPAKFRFHQGVRDFGRRFPTDRTFCEDPPRLAKQGDVLISVRAPVGRINVAVGPTGIGRGLMAVRGGESLDTSFLSYFLESMVDRWGEHESSGSVFTNLGKPQLGRIEIPLPPLQEQEGIANALGALDDKIESNQRASKIIPELIRAKVSAKLDNSAEQIAAAKLAKFVNGGAYTKDATGTGRMVIRIADLNSGPGPSTVYNELDVPDDKLARPGDILMSWSGSLGVYRWFRDEAIVNQHIFKVIPTSYPAWLVFDRLEFVLEIFQGIAKDKATTMGHIQRGHLESTFVELPSSASIAALDQELAPLWMRLLAFEQESLQLECLRDVLMPELLTGRIRVPEAEGEVA